MICKVSNDLDEIIALPEETINQLREQSKTVNNNDLIRILNILSETQDNIRIASNPRVVAEITMMKIAQPMFDESKEALIKRIENLEKVIESGNITVTNVSVPTSNNTTENNETKVEESVEYEQVRSEDVSIIENAWKNILKSIRADKNMPVYALLGDVKDFNVYDSKLYLIFDDNYGFAKTRLSSPDTIEYIQNKIREVINRSFSVSIYLKSEVKDIDLEIKKTSTDKGEEILKNIVSESILEIKDHIE